MVQSSMVQFAMALYGWRSPLTVITLIGIALTGCSTELNRTLSLGTVGTDSEAVAQSIEQPVFDPFYDAVSTAMQAADQTQMAQTEEEWRAIAAQWQAAIEMMKAVPTSHPKYDIAQQRATEVYPVNFDYAQSKAGDRAVPALTTDDDKLTQVDFGEGWPFLVDGELACEWENAGNYSVRLVTLNSVGEVFAVNDPAQSRATERGWLNMREIWRDSPLGDGKAPMTWVVMRGEALCEE